MAYDYGDAGTDFGDAQFGDPNFSDFGGLGDMGDYIGGGWNDSYSASQVPDLAAGYDLMSNPNSLQVASDESSPYQESGWSQFSKSNPRTAMGVRGLSGLFGIPGKMAMGALSQDKGMIPGMGGSMLGGAMFGPLGMIGGGILGSMAGRGLPGSPASDGGRGGASGMSGEDIASSLMQLYGASRANSGMGDVNGMNTAVQDQVKRLSEIYGPNSPYAAQMRQTLARKDAASGRNSQYGPREAQLQALLAEKQTQATDAMSRAATSGNQNALAMAKYKQQLLGQRLGLAANVGKKFGLFNMFGGGNSGSPLGGITLGSAAESLGGDYGAGGFASNGSAFGNTAADAGGNWFDDFIS